MGYIQNNMEYFVRKVFRTPHDFQFIDAVDQITKKSFCDTWPSSTSIHNPSYYLGHLHFVPNTIPMTFED